MISNIIYLQFSIDESDHGEEESSKQLVPFLQFTFTIFKIFSFFYTFLNIYCSGDTRFDNLQSPVPAKSSNSCGMSDLDLIALLGDVESSEDPSSTILSATSQSTGSGPIDSADSAVSSTKASELGSASKELLALDDLEKVSLCFCINFFRSSFVSSLM